MTGNLHDNYFDIQKSFSNGKISFEKYCQEIMSWNSEFGDIIKAQSSNVAGQNQDGSRGGRLVKKKITDKTGKQVTKWVKRDGEGNQKPGQTDEVNTRKVRESEITKDHWESALSNASDEALKNASKYAASESVRKMARDEVFRRSFNPKKFLDMSLMPDFMLEDYVSRYDNINSQLTEKEQESIHEYRDNAYFRINKKTRRGEVLDEEEEEISQDLEQAINKSGLINDIVLYRGLSSKNSLMFINYLKSLDIGDIYEEESFSSTTLLQGAAQKFKDLYSSTNNVVLKIYASKGQKGLCMQNLGSEDDKELYKDEFEFLLQKQSKFQIIEKEGNTISVKLL